MDSHELALGEMLLRLALALLCGAVVGINRDLHGKRAGLRTFGLVALGTAGITISTLTSIEPHPENVGRIVQGVLTGIGFLGAGVIVHRAREGHVTGLTTAAAVWFTASLAVICGLGEYELAVAILAIGFALLVWGRRVERRFERLLGRRPPDATPRRSSGSTTDRPEDRPPD